MSNPIDDPAANRLDPSSISGQGESTDRVKEVRENVQHAAAKAQTKATSMADEAVSKIDEKRESAADAVQGAAKTLRKVAAGGGKAVQAAYAAGRRLEASADFLHEHNLRGSLGEAERFVKSHPTESLIAAVVVGFLVGRVVRKI